MCSMAEVEQHQHTGRSHFLLVLCVCCLAGFALAQTHPLVSLAHNAPMTAHEHQPGSTESEEQEDYYGFSMAGLQGPTSVTRQQLQGYLAEHSVATPPQLPPPKISL